MGAGIEHRSIDSLMAAFQDYDLPNFAIWNGKRLCIKYDNGNTDEGLQTLLSYLNQILASNTMSVYTLKVYPEKATGINNGTLYEGSTTFMLSPTAITTNQGGVMVIDQGSKTAQYGNKELSTRLEKLEETNRELIERLHREEIKSIKTEFSNAIAGIQQQPEKSWTDRLFDYLEKTPDAIEKAFDGLGRLAGSFRPQNDYIVKQPAGSSVSGTKQAADTENSDSSMENTDYSFTTEGALINPFLQGEEFNLKPADQSKILIDRLRSLDQDAHDNIQSECMEVIEKRVGPAVLSRMILKVATLDNHDLNKLLNNLD